VPVRLYLRSARHEHGEIPVGQVGVVRQALGDLDVALGELVTDAPGSGVQHEPHPAVVLTALLQALLDEVVTAPERAQLSVRALPQLLHPRVQGGEPGPELAPPADA